LGSQEDRGTQIPSIHHTEGIPHCHGRHSQRSAARRYQTLDVSKRRLAASFQVVRCQRPETSRIVIRRVHDLRPGSVVASIPAVVLRSTLRSHAGDAPLSEGVRAEVVRRQAVPRRHILHLVPDSPGSLHYPVTVLLAEPEQLLIAPRSHTCLLEKVIFGH
jgi:hypothetical protein